uniref:Uncharacterized protein n=1 Tax=Eptatretus burgeri TaxID=7764 RepID=A0A8C4PZ68_EPTBU
FSSTYIGQPILLFLIMENQLQPETVGSSTALVNLLPALLQCFLTVACGYAAGRFGLLGPQQVRGLGNFISTFALPALLFKSMVELDIRKLNWDFLLAIAASKGVLFLIGCCSTLLGTWGPRRLAKAGLYAIFITQSNDFALGLPIVQALYKDSNPEFLQFLYMVAPISLLILNPVGFLLCEFQKLSCREGCGAVQKITLDIEDLGFLTLWGVLINPIVLFSLLGLLGSLVFQRKVPAPIASFINDMGMAFSASAQFYLGLNMVGRIQGNGQSSYLTLLLLITVKNGIEYTEEDEWSNYFIVSFVSYYLRILRKVMFWSACIYLFIYL